MKKLIALLAVSTLASTSAIAAVALSGSASVSYDDSAATAARVSSAATLTVTGTAGGTTVAAGFSLEGASIVTDSVTMSTAIGPLTISADLHDEVSAVTAPLVDDEKGSKKADTAEGNDTSISVSLAAPIGDATIGLDNSGDITVSGTFSGVTISHTIQDGSDSTTGSASIAGMDVSLTNDGGDSSWTIGTTVSGVALTLNSSQGVSAAFGLSGNTMTITHTSTDAAALVAATDTHWSTKAVVASTSTTVAISRTLTSGATLAATYTNGGSLELTASVSF